MISPPITQTTWRYCRTRPTPAGDRPGPPLGTVIEGDALAKLGQIPSGSFDCVITARRTTCCGTTTPVSSSWGPRFTSRTMSTVSRRCATSWLGC